MSVDEMIKKLKNLPDDVRKLPVVSYELSYLVELERPRIGYRDSHRREAANHRKGRRVVIL